MRATEDLYHTTVVAVISFVPLRLTGLSHASPHPCSSGVLSNVIHVQSNPGLAVWVIARACGKLGSVEDPRSETWKQRWTDCYDV